MKLTLAPFGAALAGADAVMSPYATLAATPESSLVPRSFEDRPLARRDGPCRDDSHSCLDILRGDACCRNTDYCYVDKDGEPRCCPIGSNCVENSPCKSDRFFCTTDVAVGGSVRTGTTGCCAHGCPQTSFYLCPKSLGGNCCPYGAECRSDGNCVKTKTGAATSGPGTRTGAPPGLTPTGTPLSTMDAEPTGDSLSDSRLSAGAKAGIGIGAWLCVASRRSGTMSETTASQRPRLGGGPADNYQGPSPVSGPYTETGDAAEDDAARGAPGPERAVPTHPERPGTSPRRSRWTPGRGKRSTAASSCTGPRPTT